MSYFIIQRVKKATEPAIFNVICVSINYVLKNLVVQKILPVLFVENTGRNSKRFRAAVKVKHAS